jgi:hypothetical protein
VSCQILDYDAYMMNLRTRLPFRYGMATMTTVPHLLLRVQAAFDGRRATGLAADHLPPKWFTKDPATSFRDDAQQMIAVIRQAAETGKALHPADSPFHWWQELYGKQSTWAAEQDIPPLLANFGVSLLERALIDAFCRSSSVSLADALHRNLFGIDDLSLNLLPKQPLQSIIARHTVGLLDPITTDDIPDTDRLNDGLPQSLDQCIRAYGLTHFKIKLSGDVTLDAARLRRLADTLDATTPRYRFTLDGNENFHDLAPFRRLWQSLTADPSLKPFLSNLIFVEQPLHRELALSDKVKHEMLSWPNRPPIIIDESDATMTSLPRAIECGYIGTSHKNCKGIFKGIRNACLIADLRRSRPDTPWILSGEDLSNVAPIAQLQDLAVMANLGIEHVERNSHHYFRGLSYLPQSIQDRILEKHPDLYRRHERGFATLDIRGGRMRVDSVVQAPFGVNFDFDPALFTPLDRWTFESLEA